MGTKDTPGAHDCYAAAKPDEPMFVLLARDPIAPDLVDAWADLRAKRELRETGKVSAKTEEARKCAFAMREWKRANT